MPKARSPYSSRDWAHREATLSVPDGEWRLGIVADTHSKPHPKTVERLRALNPVAILHAGDIGDPAVIDEFSTVAPVLAVRGNIDGRSREFPDAITVRISQGDETALVIYLTHIAVYGPRLHAKTRASAQRYGADVVVCGHSHVPLLVRDKPTGMGVFNPGSCGPRRFRLPVLIGALTMKVDGLSLHHICCETGQRWTPNG